MKYRLPIILIAIGLVAFATITFAMPSFFPTNASSATATTTVEYLRFNTTSATSTPLVYDAYGIAGTNQISSGNRYAANKAVLLLQLKASSTATVIKADLEYSMDGVDWYQDNLTASATAGASEAIATPNSYSWTYASTTVGGAAVTGSTNTGAKVLYIDTPTRFVRVIMSVAGANGAIWAAIQPIKEQAQP
jgi:hypothetical protein